MITYQTIFGQQIVFGQLSLDRQATILRILTLASIYKGDAFEFAGRCHRLFRPPFFQQAYHRRVMRGPVSDVYRDQFYRIYASKLKDRTPEHFFNSIRCNPLRLLLDLYLDGHWRYQSEFAEAAGLSTAQVNRAFKSVLEGKGSGEISVGRLGKALELLGASAVSLNVPVDEPRADQFFSPTDSPTGREFLITLVVSSVTKRLCGIKDKEKMVDEIKVCRDTLALYLGFIYGISDYNFLTNYIYHVLREILTAVPPVQEVSMRGLLGMVINPDAASFRLLGSGGKIGEQNNAAGCHLAPKERSDSEPFLQESLDSSAEERATLDALPDSPWGRSVKEAWEDAQTRVARWSASPLAEDGLQELLKEVRFS